MVTSQILRALAIIFLLIASLCVIGGDGSFCLYEYAGQNTIWSTDTFQAGVSDDPEMFGINAGISLLFFIPLVLSYHRGWYIFFFVLLNVIRMIFMSFAILAPSVLGLVYDSIVYCQSYWLLAWVIGESLFLILSLVFIFYEFEH